MTEMNTMNQLIAKYFAGEISENEMSQLRGWLESSVENKLLFDDLKQNWESLELQSSPNDKSRVLNRVKAKIKADEPIVEKEVKRLFVRSWYRMAASVIVAISVGTLAWYQINEPFSTLNTLGYEVSDCEAGMQKEIFLADGSHVFMNGDSRVKYKKELSGDERNIFLEGEAFFDVARNEKKPFVIGLDGAEVKVLGTSFNIKAYPEDKLMETSVLTGKVSFKHTHGIWEKDQESMFLVPGQKGVINHESEAFDQLNVDNQHDVAWMKNKLIFNNTSLLEITKTLYRMYGVNFKLSDGSLEDLKITADFENEELEEIMKILEMTSEFSYKMENDLVFIGKKDEF